MTAYARAYHPAPSHEAAASITEAGQRGSQQAVLSTLRLHGPMTVDMLTDLTGRTQDDTETACTELERTGHLERLNETGTSKRGHTCTTWTTRKEETDGAH